MVKNFAGQKQSWFSQFMFEGLGFIIHHLPWPTHKLTHPIRSGKYSHGIIYGKNLFSSGSVQQMRMVTVECSGHLYYFGGQWFWCPRASVSLLPFLLYRALRHLSGFCVCNQSSGGFLGMLLLLLEHLIRRYYSDSTKNTWSNSYRLVFLLHFKVQTVLSIIVDSFCLGISS